MRIALLNADYPAFLATLYADPALASRSYDEQMAARNASLFSTADHYSSALSALGHPTIDIHINNEAMQRAWAVEHGFDAATVAAPPTPAGSSADAARSALALPGLRRLRPLVRRAVRRVRRPWLVDVLVAQIQDHGVDVLVDQAVGAVEVDTLRRAAPNALLVAHVASNVEWSVVSRYDLLVSSLPGMVAAATERGLPSVLSRFAFAPRVLDAVGDAQHRFDVSFTGSLAAAHSTRRRLLDALVDARVPLDVFTDGTVVGLPPERRHPAVFGRAMFEVLRASAATVNDHGEVWFCGRNMTAESANNIRLFEATGVGTVLVTDAKSDLGEIFEPGVEVLTYRFPEECAGILAAVLADDDMRREVAAAGQRRVLREHTYDRRAVELADAFAAQVGAR